MNIVAEIAETTLTTVLGKRDPETLTLGQLLLWSVGAVVAFNVAYMKPWLGGLMPVYLLGLIQLTKAASSRQGFYSGLAIGFVCAAIQLHCFWRIFGVVSISLWSILGLWIGLFVALARYCRSRFGITSGLLLVPVLWTTLEYFRSELYYLRFSWLNPGYAFSGSAVQFVMHWLGVYGTGFALMAFTALINRLCTNRAILSALLLGIFALAAALPAPKSTGLGHAANGARILKVAGVQLEFPSELEVVAALDKLVLAEPQADLLMLSEYTFDRPIPQRVLRWCRDHNRYLVIGGEDPAPRSNFYDTAFVIGPTGEVEFRQVKAVPIQFFKDGLPAIEQKLWDSPWGKLGLCVCYDLSYSRVTDRLVKMGAMAILVPTMDVTDWGRRQHQLHALIAPVRAAEYGIPILRLASSGISQWVDASGRTIASAAFPGQEAIISGSVILAEPGRLPMDRWLAPGCCAVTAMLIFALCADRLVRRQYD
jgi:apolipoprotein N-acyltransferase